MQQKKNRLSSTKILGLDFEVANARIPFGRQKRKKQSSSECF